MGACNCSMFCCTLLYVHSSIAIILMGKRELVALLNLSSCCLVMVERLFLAVPRGSLQFVIVVFPDHTPLLFLENVQSAKYLGITISDNMDWGQHISEITSKATKTLGFLSRNLTFAPRSTKEVAYKTLVWPKLEYSAPIWSPYSKLQINQVEKVQRTAARWTCRRWRNTSSVGEMLDVAIS